MRCTAADVLVEASSFLTLEDPVRTGEFPSLKSRAPDSAATSTGKPNVTIDISFNLNYKHFITSRGNITGAKTTGTPEHSKSDTDYFTVFIKITE